MKKGDLRSGSKSHIYFIRFLFLFRNSCVIEVFGGFLYYHFAFWIFTQAKIKMSEIIGDNFKRYASMH